ncbi:hypothetical protein OB905_13300 [Halobacteria archaeon AArc-dxtr1]|nr:hypothetical protein [Halobacteria archaeon AArc-dxtr1]
MKVTGATAATALVAGCGDDNGDDDGNGDDDNGDEAEAIEPGEQILLEGITSGWEGLEPESIAGETNPTLVLEEGETYEIGWTQGDGSGHNVIIWDENEDLVDDYYLYGDEEEVITDPDDDGDFLEFEASSDMAYYRCYPHGQMQGDIQLE